MRRGTSRWPASPTCTPRPPSPCVAGVVLLAPVALADWRLEAGAWPYVAASAALELLYLALLATAYARAAAGFVYPTARGAAPVFVLLIGVLALGQDVSGARSRGRRDGRGRDRARARPERAARRAPTSRWRSPSAAASPATRSSTRRASATPPRPAYLLMVFVVRRRRLRRRRVAGARRRGPAPRRLRAHGRSPARGSSSPTGSRSPRCEEAPAAAVAAVRETSVVIAVGLAGAERARAR